MISLYVLGPILSFLLALAFCMVWVMTRPNPSSLLWGIAHAAYGVSVLAGFYGQQHDELAWSIFGLLASIIYFVSFWIATDPFHGRRAAVLIIVGYFGGLLLCGIGPDCFLGRAAFMVASVFIYTRAGIHFWRHLGHKVVSAAFFLKAASFMTAIAAPTTFATYQQPVWMLAVYWLTSVLLAIILIQHIIQQSKNRLAQVLEHLPDALLATRLDGTIMFCNEAYARLCDVISPAALLGKPAPILARDVEAARSAMAAVSKAARTGTLDPRTRVGWEIAPVNGKPFPADITMTSFRDYGALLILTQIHDQSERQKAESERLYQATMDKNSGLMNRAMLEVQLTQMMAESQRLNAPRAVLLIDLDHFMRVNNAMGHTVGDALIAQIARSLEALTNDGDILGRFGGDEFLYITRLLPQRDAQKIVERKAQEICDAMRRSYPVGGAEIQIGVTVGIALTNPEGNTAENMIQRAELAMYAAKSKGRGGWSLFDTQMDNRLLEDIRMNTALRRAIELNELHLLYQPIIDARNGELAKVEALIRWNSAEFGLVNPERFIPLIEQNTLILEIGKWVIDAAVRQCAIWQRARPNAPVVSINISARQFLHPAFESELVDVLRRHNVTPNHIELELTESVLVTDDVHMAALLARLARRGLSISLDDFGTGYSSLSYLARYNVNTVKIDQDFIIDLENNERHRSLVRVIIAMGHSLGMKVVAEGVETQSQRDFLLKHGCDYLQGYLLSRPLAADSVLPPDTAGVA
jgi:diguanylate cyclase (GGDEF)-like protein/PAS domain S-box-containing protein